MSALPLGCGVDLSRDRTRGYSPLPPAAGYSPSPLEMMSFITSEVPA